MDGSRTIPMGSVDSGMERYRHADDAVWRASGLRPTERFGDAGRSGTRIRVLEVGTGKPLLFVHGTAGPGAWPLLVKELSGFQSLVLERPGWGLSSPVDYAKQSYGAIASDVLQGVLDGLGIDKVTVVGNSIGNNWAMHLAATYPDRVDGVILLGGGPLTNDVPVPGIIRLIASPIGAVMARLPDNAGRIRSILKGGGHGPALETGRLDAFIEWRLALGRSTLSMRSERTMIRTVVRGHEWRNGLAFADAELARIDRPTLFVYGSADSVGSEAIWRRFVDLLPDAELVLLDDAGHEPWFEQPSEIADHIRRFLADGRPEQR